MADAIVIGAGLAGISCAHYAKKRGLQVKIYEATPTAGGRIRSFQSKHSDVELDNGTHLVLKAYHNSFDYLALIGQKQSYRPAPLEKIEFFNPSTQQEWAITPSNLLKSLYYGDIPGFGWKDLLATLKVFFSNNTEPFAPKNPQAIQNFWDPLSLAVFNIAFQDLTRLQIKHLLRALASSGLDGFTPYLEEKSLKDRFITPGLDQLDIEYGFRLKSIKAKQTLSFTNGQILKTGQTPIVLALPYPALNQIDGLANFPEFDNSPILNIHYFFETGQKMRFCGLIGAEAQWVFITPNRASVTISASTLKPTKEQVEKIWSEISFLFSRTTCPPFQSIVEKQATPQQNRDFVNFQKAFDPVQEGIIYAGDWTVDHLPLTIESAIFSGKRAAAAIKPQ